MKKLKVGDFSDGFPSKHRIRFVARRVLVEGGYLLGDDTSAIEYEGRLFESNHSETYLCVKVDREAHWGRSRDWHGYIHRDNVVEIILVDDANEAVPFEGIRQLACNSFLFHWEAYIGKTPRIGEGSGT